MLKVNQAHPPTIPGYLHVGLGPMRSAVSCTADGVAEFRGNQAHVLRLSPFFSRDLFVWNQLAMKEKMLMKLERDRTKAKIEAIEAQMKAMQVSVLFQADAPTCCRRKTIKSERDLVEQVTVL